MKRTAKDFICFSAQDYWYHNRAHSDIQLMSRIASERRVLFINSIGMRMPAPGRSTQPWRRMARKARSIAKLVRRPIPELPGFTVMTPVTLPFYGIPRVRRLNARLVGAQVWAVSKALGFHEIACVLTIPTAWEVISHLRVDQLIFNRSDKHSAFPEVDKAYIAGLEEQLLKHSEHVLYVSRQLMADEAELTGNRAVFLDHGVDLGHFRRRQEADEPADMKEIPRPRIGFFGGIDDYVVDLLLLEELAREYPDAQLVLIGDATCSMERLTDLPNVHWLGAKPYEFIPRYGSGFDVALMPWLDNEWIRSCNPIKLKEYLALGLPVVSTNFPEVRHYEDVVEIAMDRGDFVKKVGRLIDEGCGDSDSERRRSRVSSADWLDLAKTVIRLSEEIDVPETKPQCAE